MLFTTSGKEFPKSVPVRKEDYADRGDSLAYLVLATARISYFVASDSLPQQLSNRVSSTSALDERGHAGHLHS